MEQQILVAILQFLSHLSPSVLLLLIILGMATPAGVVMLILILWRNYERNQSELLETYRSDMQRLMEAYRDDVDKVTQYYKDNVELVRGYHSIAKDLKDVIVLNTQAITRVCVQVDSLK